MPTTHSVALFIHSSAQLVTPIFSPEEIGPRLMIRVIPDGALLVENGAIAAVGSTSDLSKDPRASLAKRIDASGCVVSPGFVDSHTHLVFARTRHEEYEMRIHGESYESIAASGGGIRNSVRRLRAASEETLFRQARQWCDRFIAHGATTIEAKSGYGLDVESELRILRVLARLNADDRVPLQIVPTFLGAHEIPEEFRGNPEQYVDLICREMIPCVAREKLAEFCDVFCETGVFSVEQSRRILQTARSYGLRVKVHADQLTHNGGTRLAVELGAVSADHLEHIDGEDVELLSRSSVVATLLPGASFFLGMKQLAPARRLIDAGVVVALATDFNPGTSPTVNMQTILSIAGSSLRMTPAESLAAATLGGACALARGGSLGALEAGRQADVVLFSVEDYRKISYHYGMNWVRGVIKQGRIVFWEGSNAPAARPV